MNQVYTQFFRNLFSLKRITMVAFLLTFAVMGARSQQVVVTATGGVVGPTNYTTLKGAFDAINAGTHQGNINIAIAGNTNETATAVLNGSVAPANYIGVTIKPTGAARIIQGNIAGGALVKLNGADNVVIDGSLTAGTRDLTFRNTSTTGNPTVIWVGSASTTDGASQNFIMNSIVEGGGSTTGFIALVQSSGTTIGGTAESPNNANVYANLAIRKAQYGIALVGSGTANDIENTITFCEIGDISGSNPADKIGWRGMFIAQQFNVTIEDNTIKGVDRASGGYDLVASGIYIGGIIDQGIIQRNRISDVHVPGPWGSNGIQLQQTQANCGLVIQNNFIWDIYAGGYSGNNDIADNAYGIGINSGGGYKIYYNSISTSHNPDGGSSSDMSSAIWIGESLYSPAFPIQNLDIRNNIFSNTRTVGTRYGINVQDYPNTIFTQLNNNDYFSSSGNVGRFGAANAANIAAWRSLSGRDAQSLDIDPQFVSATDLHLFGMSPLDGLAQPIAGITSDIDGDARNATTPDIGADEFTPPPCTNPSTGGTASTSVSEICGSGSSILSAAGYTWGLGTTYQWEQSIVSATGPWTNVTGAVTPVNANTGTISATHWYRLKVVCSAGAPGYSTVVQIIVNNPQVTGTTPASRCGIGTVTLGATGANLRWYDVPSGGAALGTGGSFTTPVINATTTYYVGASSGGTFLTGGKPAPTETGAGYTGNAGIVFDAAQAFTLQSVDIYPESAGTITIEAITGTGALIPGCSWTGAVPATSMTVPVNITLNFPIPVGTDFRLIKRDFNISIRRDFSGNPYPYSLAPACTLVSGVLGTTGNTNANVYYYFYNWKITTACEGVRQPIVATVNPAPALTITPSGNPASNRIICAGENITLTVSSSASPAYTYTWQPGGVTGNTITVNPMVTTDYTVSANNGTCRNDSTITVTTTNAPAPITISPATINLCPNIVQSLIVSGGQIPEQVIMQEKFESFPNTFTSTNAGQPVTQNTTYFAEGLSSAHITYANSQGDPGAGGWESPSFNLSGSLNNPVLRFKHIAALEGTNTTDWDFGRVEYSINGGSSWTTFPSSAYLGAGAVYQGTVSFNRSSYPDWNTVVNVSTALPNNSLWKEDSVSLASLVGNANVKIRFRIKSDGSVLYYGWLIDDVKVTAFAQGTITWAPTTNLYMDNGHTTPYTGQSTNTVYFWSPVDAPAQIYTATASGGNASCDKTNTTTVSVTSTGASVAVNPASILTYCKGETMTLNAIPTNGGPAPGFRWFINGAPYHLSAEPDSITARFAPGSFNNGDVVTVQMLAVGVCPINVTSAPVTITVNDTAIISITSPTTQVCSNAPTTLTATVTNAPPVVVASYQWYRNGVIMPGETGNTLNINQFGDYQIEVTTNKGCATMSAVKKITQDIWNVDIQPGPNGSISPAGPVLSVPCGDAVTFTVTPNPGYTIQDVLIDGVSVGATAGPHTFYPTNDALVEAFFEISGCPNPPTAFAGNNTALCSSVGYYVLASQGPNIGGTATAATWSSSGSGTFDGGGVFGTATRYYFSAADIAAGFVNITLTTNNPAGAPCIPSTSTFKLTLTPSPVVNISGTLGFCSAGVTSTTLTANAIFSAGTITGYQWYRISPTAATLGTASTQTITSAGKYRVVVSGSNSCAGYDTVDVVQYAPPVIDSITGTLYFCQNGNTNILANISLGDAAIDPNGFVWEYNDVPPPPTFVVVTGANNQALNVSSIGQYRARVADLNGCLSAYSSIVSVTYDMTPMSGNYTIGMGPASCTNFLSFSDAVEALNLRTINGDCIFTAPAGYTEVVPFGGLQLGSAALSPTTNAHNILFTASGTGSNPLLIAYNGGNGLGSLAKPDGIWGLNGVDNVTINKIDLIEDTLINTTDNTRMEYGFGLFNRINNDGPKNNVIQNCNIRLSRKQSSSGTAPMNNGSTGILLINAASNAAITAFVPTNQNGTASGNKFFNNIIRDVTTGIYLNGYEAPSPYTLADKNNEIGGSTAGTGNQVINFGKEASGPALPTGIFTQNQWDVSISYNTIKNNDGTGEFSKATVRGIWNEASDNANGLISQNTIELKRDAPVASTYLYGIDTKHGVKGTNNTVSIANNNIKLVNDNAGTVISGVVGINYNYLTNDGPSILSIQNNTLHDFENNTTNVTALTSGLFGIYANTRVGNTLNITGNVIHNFSRPSSGGALTSAPTITGILMGGNGANSGGAPTTNIQDNIIRDFAALSNTTVNVIAGIMVFPRTNTTTDISRNTIKRLSVTGLSGATTQGYIAGIISQNTTDDNAIESIQGNIIDSLWVTGSPTPSALNGIPLISGMMLNNNRAGGSRVINQNIISNLYSASGTLASVNGMSFLSGTSSTTSIRRNHISRLFAGQPTTGTLSSAVRGIYFYNLQAVGSGEIINNYISLDLTQASSPMVGNELSYNYSLLGIDFSNSNAAVNWKVYYNTIRLAGSGTGNFGSAPIQMTQPNTNNDIRNNIFANYSVASGTGYSTAFRRATTNVGYVATSNNNDYYTTGVASAPMAHVQALTYATLADFKASAYAAGGRESASIDEEPVFVDEANNDLHLATSTNCTFDGGAQPIPSITIDYDNDARDAVKPDIGADEFIGTGGPAYTWKGVNTDWEDVANWCPKIPDATTNVTIPTGLSHYPILTTTTNKARNITIDAGARIEIDNGAKLTLYGTMLQVEGTFTNDGEVNFNAGAGVAQSIDGAGTINPMNILTVNNVAGFTIKRAFSIYGELRPTAGNITVNEAVTLASSATQTAQVSELGAGVNITYGVSGRFIVENFIKSNGRAAWRFVSAPIQAGSQTIRDAWQEGETPGVYTATGYGTQIVGPTSAGTGFDLNNPFTSIKTYDFATNNWNTTPGTDVEISNLQGYMLFVRGDRGANVFGLTSNTTLRVSGKIKTGNVTVNGPGVANKFFTVANPYPSAIDFSTVSRTNVNDQFYVWDPKLGSSGGYQTFAGPTYIATPGGGSYGGGNDMIESGQAFLVFGTNATASVMMKEADKVSGSNNVTRAEFTGRAFTTKLYSNINHEPNLIDGTRSEFENGFSSAVDFQDAPKAANFNEGIAILVNSELIAVERRPDVIESDTIFYKLSGLVRQPYQLELTGINMSGQGLEGWLEDLYLQTRTPVNFEDVTTYDFEVNTEAGSYAPDRFRIVFKVMRPVPVTFVTVDAMPVDKDIRVRFRVANEENIRNYTVERSINGREFVGIGEVAANRNRVYEYLDLHPGSGTFFYRIRSNGFVPGDVKYSSIAAATIGTPSVITVYPNPVKGDKIVRIKMENMKQGTYHVVVYGTTGQEIYHEVINHTGRDTEYAMPVYKLLVHGTYLLQVTDDRKQKTIVKFVY